MLLQEQLRRRRLASGEGERDAVTSWGRERAKERAGKKDRALDREKERGRERKRERDA